MINQEIYDLIKSHNGCAWGLSKVSSTNSVSGLVRILKSPRGVEFAMENDFLSLDLLERYRNNLEAEGILFDGVHTLVNPRFALVLGGQVNIEVNGYEVSQIYAKKGTVKITAVDNAFVTIELKDSLFKKEVFDNAKIREFIK